MKQHFSNSQYQKFALCQMFYYWLYVRRIAPAGTDVPKTVGKLIHAANKIFYSKKDFNEGVKDAIHYLVDNLPPTDDVKRNAAQVVLIMQHYYKYWRGKEPITLHSEIDGTVDIGECVFKFIVDMVVKTPFGEMVKETKSTAYPNPWNWRHMNEHQITAYCASTEILLGEEIKGGIIDVIPIDGKGGEKDKPFRLYSMRNKQAKEAWLRDANNKWLELQQCHKRNWWTQRGDDACVPWIGRSCTYVNLCVKEKNPFEKAIEDIWLPEGFEVKPEEEKSGN